MSVEQEKRIQSLYASLKSIMNQNLTDDEKEQILEWMHILIVDKRKEKELQKLNSILKRADRTLPDYTKMVKKRNQLLPSDYPKNLKIGDVVNVKFGFGYCSEISDDHYGIIFSEYIAGLYLVFPLSSEPLKKFEVYLENLNLPNKEGIKDKRSYIQFNHSRFIYYRRLENVKGRSRINIGTDNVQYVTRKYLEFLNLKVDESSK